MWFQNSYNLDLLINFDYSFKCEKGILCIVVRSLENCLLTLNVSSLLYNSNISNILSIYCNIYIGNILHIQY